jgi:hypothetical protein
MMVVNPKPHLFQVVSATDSVSCFPNLLHRRHKQTHQNCDDGNHHQQFDESKSSSVHFHSATQSDWVNHGCFLSEFCRYPAKVMPKWHHSM